MAFVLLALCVDVKTWVPVECLHYAWVCLTMWVLLDNFCFLEREHEYERRLRQPDMFEVILAIREELGQHRAAREAVREEPGKRRASGISSAPEPSGAK